MTGGMCILKYISIRKIYLNRDPFYGVDIHLPFLLEMDLQKRFTYWYQQQTRQYRAHYSVQHPPLGCRNPEICRSGGTVPNWFTLSEYVTVSSHLVQKMFKQKTTQQQEQQQSVCETHFDFWASHWHRCKPWDYIPIWLVVSIPLKNDGVRQLEK